VSLHLGWHHRHYFSLVVESPSEQGNAHFEHSNLEPQLYGVRFANQDRHPAMLQSHPIRDSQMASAGLIMVSSSITLKLHSFCKKGF